jgi:hypothetical protein
MVRSLSCPPAITHSAEDDIHDIRELSLNPIIFSLIDVGISSESCVPQLQTRILTLATSSEFCHMAVVCLSEEENDVRVIRECSPLSLD